MHGEPYLAVDLGLVLPEDEGADVVVELVVFPALPTDPAELKARVVFEANVQLIAPMIWDINVGLYHRRIGVIPDMSG